ncbi:MAG: hypothetical protein Q7T51_00130 [Candidatus Moranbacteria bacterium]|nr:hypothetical protein [Candidatus Moranbacteria bacterium]
MNTEVESALSQIMHNPSGFELVVIGVFAVMMLRVICEEFFCHR